MENDTNKWAGKIKIGGSYVKTSTELLTLFLNNHLQYENGKNMFLILTNYKVSKSASESFQNAGTQHFRYNYKINKKLTFEAFTQAQYNKLLNVNFRWLLGTGPRYTLLNNGKNKINIAALYMYQYEELTDPQLIHRDHRISSYISMNFKIANHVSFNNTTYFQPKLTEIGDFRVYSQFNLQFSISKSFAFSTAYRLYYDSKPPEGIVQRTHFIENALTFTFK